MADRITANLPSSNFDATVDFYGKLGFAVGFRNEGWLILQREGLELEFFHHPTVDKWTSWFSACVRVDNLDDLRQEWLAAGLDADTKSIPRLTEMFKLPDAPRMFALVDADGSLLRCIDNKG